MTSKIRKFIEETQLETPCLIVDLDVVSARYRELAGELPDVELFYAVKANPARQVLARLSDLGAGFDAASFEEIELCLAAGIPCERIIFGNTIKRARDIARAHDFGIGPFAFDSRGELLKIAREARGSEVFCRIFMEGIGAEWPLTRKFGCTPDKATELLQTASDLGLSPVGVSFHVGSQQKMPSRWEVGICLAAQIFDRLEKQGIRLRSLNIGGGFPARYREPVRDVSEYGRVIREALKREFGGQQPQIIAEPGRSITGDAGCILSEVILIAETSRETGRRWVFLDIGKFGGLPETYQEAICYRITTPHDGGPEGPVVIAGPTCDEVDVLYDSASYRLPLALVEGDRIMIHGTGAYTVTYASVGFNGFSPPEEYYL